VTIGAAGSEKTYDTVNKLFTLSKVHPVGLMVFGNSEFMGYPWETIVKSYRQQKGAAAERTIAKWGADFLTYVSGFGDIIDADKSRNIQIIVGSLFEELQDDVFAEAREKEIAVPSADYVALLKSRLTREIETLKDKDDYFQERQKSAFAEKYAEDMGAPVGEFFQSFKDDELDRSALQFALFSLFKKTFSPQSSGFVIAGFGEDENYPALVSYETDGYIGDVLKVEEMPGTVISRDLSSSIRPFAQKEMVVRFMDGVDPILMQALWRIFATTLDTACLDVLDKYGDAANKIDDIRKLIHKAAVAAIRTVDNRIKEIQRRHFARPITQMVSLLPKEELPHLAESLVALTSLKRHVSRDAETVGGPIDVCLISKGDGFIWIKRKHYFKPELNTQFVRNYMRGIPETGDGDERPRTRRPARTARKQNQKTKASSPATAK
jgi:hypothetical protein